MKQRILIKLPEPGQLVEVRRRQWVVSEIQGSTSGRSAEHLVSLNSIEEDAVGEELSVIWEIEPGARVIEKAGLPAFTGIDSKARLDVFLDAVRWGAVTNADKNALQAPFRSGISIEDFQLDPLVRAVDMARVNLLIADDVGLGKTIEAGLIVQEMIVRHRARTAFIICPSSLQVKWKEEMWEKFGLEFRIVDTAYIKQLRRKRGLHANPWTSFPRLITSMDWIKSGEGLRLLKDCLPPHISYPRKFDILIIDEAHNIAPSTATKYAIESQRTKMVRTIAPHFEHKLFLSATPHNGYQESFTSLLELLDNQRFARTVMPDPDQLQKVMIRRLKSELVGPDGKPIYPERVLLPLKLDYSADEREVHQLLKDYTQSRMQTLKGSEFGYGAMFIHKLLKKRLFSSPRAFSNTILKHIESMNSPRIKSKDILHEKILQKAILKAEEDFNDDWSADEAQNDAVQTASKLIDTLVPQESTILEKLKSWAQNHTNSPDSKSEAIVDWIKTHLQDPDGSWNGKRVILFTEFRDTHTWLNEILAANLMAGDRLMSIDGSVDSEEREVIKAAFQAHPDVSPVRILLATDAASEGIDLQNYCNYMIHVEIPWNPNVLEQRNGRIDRHGQKSDQVKIWHPVGKTFSDSTPTSKVGELEGDHEFLLRAVLKVNTIREDLGSVGPVIANQIEEAMIDGRTNLNTQDAEAKALKAKSLIRNETQLKEKIKKLHQRLNDSREEFNLSPENVFAAVTLGLELAEKPTLKGITKDGFPEGSLYELPVLSGSWSKATQSLEHPHTHVRRPITFDHEVAKGRDDVVLIHLNHRLVQMCLRLLREELWNLDDVKKLNRISILKSSKIESPVALVWSRLVITGGDQKRLHEELTISGGEIKSTSYSRIPTLQRLDEILNSAIEYKVSESHHDILKDRFNKFESKILDSVEARSKSRAASLEKSMKVKEQAEIKDISNVLDDLAKNISLELAPKSEPQQMSLFSEDEQSQIKKDVASLKARLDRVPEEKQAEIDLIKRRYMQMESRTFPVAVILVMPDQSVGEN